ncbi:Dihydrolipoyllysine-residue acetyltransferase component of pyruvate dehydrogenase complex [Tepidimonas thermarum]|uniref:Dihydrolipoamide acetyltransferase component of pyruvate dehydrogenase complex n=1 Tax=Tepidimonas thermarum TaxID=335431 RepID=A0A554X927_9BURK|nr:dihydrolipoyllysine-residue acetyltransferase [Tepidimonas thermarum]TSE32296.1 Dihydrolipoyllysine-residue acetyltransferase component of pyruvate dehydrogenase complex [Tepidimonas thermarum]
MALVEVKVPDIGDFKDVAVIELLVKPGDAVQVDQSLITVESDKASMEIPSSHAGVVRELKVQLGDKVSEGSVVALLETEAQASAAAPASVGGQPAPAAPAPAVVTPQVAVAPVLPVSASAPASLATVAVPAPPPPATAAVPAAAPSVPAAAAAHDPTRPPLGLPHASPSVRKVARELGVPLAEVRGTGPKGRITLEDVQAFTRAVMAGEVQTRAQAAKAPAAPAAGDGAALGLIPWPTVDFAKFGPIERRELSRIKKISGANLMRNAAMIPAVTNHDDADVTELEAFRVQLNEEHAKSGVKVTMLAFLVKACVAALQKFPEFNSSLDMASGGDALIYKRYWNIGFAADTPNGLVVPVIKSADQKGILQISREMAELAAKAREGKLAPADMSGATFTISSLGGIGGRYFTPIINAPEVAILGVCKSRWEPVWNGKEFTPRLMLPLSLTWDHRVIDGAAAARFNAYLAQLLADFRRILL